MGLKNLSKNGFPTSADHHGNGLVSNRSSEWRYRLGDYRLIADIQDEKVIS